MPAPAPARHPAHDALLTRWADLLATAREATAEAKTPSPVPYGEDLLTRWAEPQRRYHTTDHLLAVLDRVDELLPHVQAPDPAAVRLAAWFHDAVYLPDRSTNEERSARLAERALTEAAVPAPRTAETVRLVLLTRDHDPAEGDTNGEVLCDADLAVLAGSPEDYGAYAAAVREEYAFVPDDTFREGRANVLRHLLGLPHLFRTPAAHNRWEAPARHNMTTELELLGA
ncbi:HD domain-containing protein [Streptomyces malaysiensis]|uniref:HD domain-containing protein n=1 Tax=Streptomyces malaysiensis TaxID=92644 RepID=UPI003685FD0F